MSGGGSQFTRQSIILQKVLGILVSIGGLVSSGPVIAAVASVSSGGYTPTVVLGLIYVAYVVIVNSCTRRRYPYFASYFILGNIGVVLLLILVAVGVRQWVSG